MIFSTIGTYDKNNLYEEVLIEPKIEIRSLDEELLIQPSIRQIMQVKIERCILYFILPVGLTIACILTIVYFVDMLNNY